MTPIAMVNPDQIVACPMSGSYPRLMPLSAGRRLFFLAFRLGVVVHRWRRKLWVANRFRNGEQAALDAPRSAVDVADLLDQGEGRADLGCHFVSDAVGSVVRNIGFDGGDARRN